MLGLFKFRIRMLFKYKDLLFLLVQRDIKLRYRRSFLGYVWSILNPLLDMVVKVIVFSYLFSRGIENFPVYLISGQILYSFMRESSTQALRSIVGSASLMKKVYVPKYIFTLSKVTSAFVNLLFSLGALLLVMVITKVRFSWSWFGIVIPMLELYVFCVGLGLFLAAATVFFRDISNIWSVVTLGWMYLTPIFYDLNRLSPTLQYWIPKLNPLYMYIRPFRDLILEGGFTNVAYVWRGLFVAVLMLFIGLFVFTRTKDKFILYI